MVVAAAERQEVVLFSERDELFDCLRRVVFVVDLKAPHARRLELDQDRLDILPLAAEFGGMRPAGEAAALHDALDALGGRHALALDVRGAVAADPLVEGIGDLVDVAGLDERLRDVRAPDRRLAGDLLHTAPLDHDAHRPQLLDDAEAARDAADAQLGEDLLQLGVLRVEVEAEHVHFGAVDVGAHLDAGDQRVTGVLRGRDARLGDALGRVVVGEGVVLHALLRRQVDDLGRREAAIGGRAVRVEVALTPHRCSIPGRRARWSAHGPSRHRSR